MEYNKWFESGKYKVDIDELRTNIMKECSTSNSEATTSSIFERELYFMIRQRTGIKLELTKEKQVDNIKHIFGQGKNKKSGRLDAIVNNLIIEYKHNIKLKTKKQFDEAITQVKNYIYTIYTKDKIKYNAILTDGLRIAYFSFNGDKICNTMLSPINNSDIDTIIKALINNSKKKFVSSNIINDFIIDSKIESPARILALDLYKLLKQKATAKTKMLYSEWENLMHLSVDDNGKGNDIEKRRHDLSLIFNDTIDDAKREYLSFYALQTTYAIIVKLIACKVIDKIEFNNNTNSYHDLTSISSSDLQTFIEKMEDGYSYKSNNVYNLLEGDFFSWYSDKKQWDTSLYKDLINIIKLIDQYTSFNFNITYEPVDIFKDLYLCIIPQSIRHSMGEYFTPEWLSDFVIDNSISMLKNKNWKAIDPCCGSGIFIISLIKKIVGDCNINNLTLTQKESIKNNIIERVYGIDINPLAVLSARVGYYLALLPFGNLRNIEIPIYLGDSAILPNTISVDGISCYEYMITNNKLPLNIILPARLVNDKDFSIMMNELQACVKTDDNKILYEIIIDKLNDGEKKNKKLLYYIERLSIQLTQLHKNKWDGIWVRIALNFMLIARLNNFDIIVGNPPWVKWEHLPAVYASKIKELCNIKHIFNNEGGQYGGTQLNICALISNVVATKWLNKSGVLAFLMPDSIMAQNSYSEFRNFYIDYDKKLRMYINRLDRWLPPLRPFYCANKPVTQDFNTYYFKYDKVEYKKGIPVYEITRSKIVSDDEINKHNSFKDVEDKLLVNRTVAKQLSNNSTAFSYEDRTEEKFDYSKIIGKTSYLYRTGVEFTPQELYILKGLGKSKHKNKYYFENKKFQRSKYVITDMPNGGWEFNTNNIYPIVTGPSLIPFCYNVDNEFCILPYNHNDTKNPIPIDDLMKSDKELFKYLANHKDIIDKQSEKSKAMHRGDEFYALSKIGDYTFAKNIVAVRDNTHFCAALVKPEKTPWGVVKNNICVKHTIIISQDIEKNFISLQEGYYLTGILNSSIVINYIENTFKSNGYSLNHANLYIPKFDKNNAIHMEIANIAKNAKRSKSIIETQKELSILYLKLCENK